MNPYRYLLKIEEKEYTSAQNSMQETLLKLIKLKKNYNISVKLLCENAHVARTTFYAYYQNIDEILEEIENNLIYDLMNLNKDIMHKDINRKEELLFFDETKKFIEENKITIYTLLITCPNYRFIEKWKDAIKYHFYERLYKKHKDKNYELTLEMIASLIMSAYIYWLKNPYDLSNNDIYTILSKVLQGIDLKKSI